MGSRGAAAGERTGTPEVEAEAPADSVDEGPDLLVLQTRSPWFQLAAVLRSRAQLPSPASRTAHAQQSGTSRLGRCQLCHRRRQESGNPVDTHM